MRELKRSGYGHSKAVALGSRQQMCIDPVVSKQTNSTQMDNMCRVKVKGKKCCAHTLVDSGTADQRFREPDIMDIEELVKVGRELNCCPYYMARKLVPYADIVFMPYNYLLGVQDHKGVELYNAIVILDEAHNVEKVCEDAASVQISSSNLAGCIKELKKVRIDQT